MKAIFRIGLLILSLAIPTTILHAKPADDADATIRSVLKKQFPDLSVDAVKQSPVNGVYEVTAGATVLYLTGDGRYAFSGDIIDLQSGQTNLTEEVRKSARVKGIKSIGEQNMIVFPAKKPKHVITVFTDVDCGYCRKLHADVNKLNDLGITVRYLAFPRSGPNTPTFEKMISIWCAKDKKQALTLAKQDKKVEQTTCPTNSVLQEFQLGMMMGVNGTPTMVFEDGTMFPGYLPPEKILEVVEHLHTKQKQS